MMDHAGDIAGKTLQKTREEAIAVITAFREANRDTIDQLKRDVIDNATTKFKAIEDEFDKAITAYFDRMENLFETGELFY